MPESREIVVYDRTIDMPEGEENFSISHQTHPKTATAYHTFEPSMFAAWTAAFVCASLPLFVRSVVNLGELTWDPVNIPVQLAQSAGWAVTGSLVLAFGFVYQDDNELDEYSTIYRQWPHHKADYDADVREDQAKFHAMNRHIRSAKLNPDAYMTYSHECELELLKGMETRKLQEEIRLAKIYDAVSGTKKTAILSMAGGLAASFSAATLYYGYNAVSSFSALLNGGFNMEDGFTYSDKFLPGVVSTVAATVLTPLAYASWTCLANHAQRQVIDKNTGMLAPQVEPGV